MMMMIKIQLSSVNAKDWRFILVTNMYFVSAVFSHMVALRKKNLQKIWL